MLGLLQNYLLQREEKVESNILKVEWLLTRKCNLKCSYCQIRRPCSLQGMELSEQEVYEGVRVINRLFPEVPIIFFGGEPTVLDWLPSLIAFCESLKVKYAVISNGVRVVADRNYFERLVKAGISNWSVSVDSLRSLSGLSDVSTDSEVKTYSGIRSLRMFREAGVKDLVACITVTNKNIRDIPQIVRVLSSEGVWGITTPLQRGGMDREYSAFSPELECDNPEEYLDVARELKEMALSGKYLMHNSPEFYDWWGRYFHARDWVCETKNALTIDADGSLKRCVDQKGGLDRYSILNLDVELEDYLDSVSKPHGCDGCFWDPAFETSLRAKTWDRESAVKSFRHELTPEQNSNLLPEVKRWFE